jgi:mannosyltransferase OCH1-like enzyme
MNYIHFIWLGPVKIPREIIDSWQPKQDDYSLLVWRDFPDEKNKNDINISELGNFRNKKLFNTSVKNNQKSDILRLAILYKYGGVYLDCDILKTGDQNIFEQLNKIYSNKRDFYISFEKKNCISNSFIAAFEPRNEIIDYLIDGLKNCKITDASGKYYSVWKTTGPKYITAQLNKLKWGDIIPYHFINFGIDIAKTFTSPHFIIQNKFKIRKYNKDLRYNPVFNEIMGVQLWFGGKSHNYENVSCATVKTTKLNYEKYLAFVKQFYALPQN